MNPNVSNDISMVRVTHYPEGARWPEGSDRNFAPFHAPQHNFAHTLRDGRSAAWNYRFYDPYSAYVSEGLPAGQPQHGRLINNVAWVPSTTVLDRMVRDLEQISKKCSVLWWDAAIQCFPYVAQHLKKLFRLTILSFGDDMPGSSEIKTFPVAPFFDVLLHLMYTWDFQTGQTVPEVYGARGIRDCRFWAWGPFETVYTDAWFAEKVARIRANALPVDIIWLGGSGISLRRRQLLQNIVSTAGKNPKTRFHGNGMRDGWYKGKPSDHYGWSIFGLNIAESSFFNGRFADLCMSGTIQLAHDPHGELSRFGFVDGEHFLNFDGTAEGFSRRMAEYRGNSEALAQIATTARARFVEYRATYDDAEVQSGVILDYEKQIREGRS